MPRSVKSKKSEQLSLGEAIRFHRRRAGVTQRQLAAGIRARPDSVLRIERGYHQPSIERLVAIADALGVSPESLLARGAESLPDEMIALMNELRRLDPATQAFIVETLRQHVEFFARGQRSR